jgi:hypothetical protein
MALKRHEKIIDPNTYDQVFLARIALKQTPQQTLLKPSDRYSRRCLSAISSNALRILKAYPPTTLIKTIFSERP